MVTKLPAPELPAWLAERVPFERYLVELDGGLKMHVMEQGSGRPVVLFHGNPTWGYLYRRVAAELAGEDFRIILPDLIGFGLSDRVSMEEHTLANHSAWMGDLIGQLDLENAIAGLQDWGGPIGLQAMIQHPGSFGAVLVMNTSLGAPRQGFKPTRFHRYFSSSFGVFLSKYLRMPQNYLARAQGDRSSIDKSVQAGYSYVLRNRTDYQSVIGLVRMVPDSHDHPSIPYLSQNDDFLASYEGPAAIVWGDKDPVLGRLRRRLERTFPQAESNHTEGGHFVQEEQPELIADAIRRLGPHRDPI